MSAYPSGCVAVAASNGWLGEHLGPAKLGSHAGRVGTCPSPWPAGRQSHPSWHPRTLGGPGEVAYGAVNAAGLGLVGLGGEGCNTQSRRSGQSALVMAV